MNDDCVTIDELLGYVWKQILAGIFSVMGRLVALSSCRYAEGKYHHEELTKSFGSEAASRAICLAHQLVWMDWLRGSLSDQQLDIVLYLRVQPEPLEEIVRLWLDTRPFLALIPDSAHHSERTLFTHVVLLSLGAAVNRLAATYSSPDLADDQLPEPAKSLLRLAKERYANPNLSLCELSQEMKLPERQLGCLFQRYVGKGFRQYVLELRMEAAMKFLAGSPLDVKAIAGEVGYNDPSNFGRHFKIHLGCTPLEFRAKSGGGKNDRRPRGNLSDSVVHTENLHIEV